MGSVDINKIIGVLEKPKKKEKPWMTAAGIARREEIAATPKQVEEALIRYCRDSKDEPRIRYSTLPSRKTLDVLWGATQNVGERELMNLAKDNVADDSLSEFENVSEAEADLFFSHSHRDYDSVMSAAKLLLKHKIFPWLAETHIGQGEMINAKIIDAFGTSRAFLLFLSQNALRSRWTGKEYEEARRRKLPIFLLIDGDGEESKWIADFFRHGTGRSISKPSGGAATFFDHIVKGQVNIVRSIVYAQGEEESIRSLASAIQKHKRNQKR